MDFGVACSSHFPFGALTDVTQSQTELMSVTIPNTHPSATAGVGNCPRHPTTRYNIAGPLHYRYRQQQVR